MLNKEGATYLPDLLDGFEQMQINMPNDYEGSVVCTLVRKLCTQPSKKAVLYIHGFQDYFFQQELAEQFIEHGYNFYAIDLRKSGRSLLSHQIPYNVRSITEYYMDIDVAIKQLKADGNSVVVLNAHSTGGLTAALYANEHKNTCDALILNSPFLKMNKGKLVRRVAIPLIIFAGNFCPNMKIKAGFSRFYGESIHKGYKGEWDYNLHWKPISCEFVTAGWTTAICKAHKAISKGLSINCPVLVMTSEQSLKGKVWTDDFKHCDVVLNVNDIRKLALNLGNNINIVSFKNGLHDLILSEKPVRETVYRSMFAWLHKNLASPNAI